MGLIKAAMGAAGGVLADQWKEYFYCEAIPADVLAVKGKKKVTGRSSNTKGDDNIITNGSRDRHCGRPVHAHRGAGQGGGCVRRARRIHLRYVHRAEHFLRRSGRWHR